MWPQLAMALASTYLRGKEEEDMHRQAVRQRAFDVQNSIAARRAARAGDSGYMQSALAIPAVKRQPSQAGAVLSQVGQALASQEAEPGAMYRDDNEDGYLPTRMYASEF